MHYAVKQYPGEADIGAEIIMLTESHGSFTEAQIDMITRAARWWEESKDARKITAPDKSTAICWENGKIAFVLTAESNEVAV